MNLKHLLIYTISQLKQMKIFLDYTKLLKKIDQQVEENMKKAQ